MESQKILIVDDDPEIREVLRLLLESEGYQVVEAASGEQVLEKLDDSVGLVILDVMMPDMNGYGVCAEIRKRSAVPVLFLTAKSQDSDKTLGFSAGGDDYLVKPFSYSELISRVKAMQQPLYRGFKRFRSLPSPIRYIWKKGWDTGSMASSVWTPL